MNGFAFVVLYVSVTVVVAAIWMVFRPESPSNNDVARLSDTSHQPRDPFLGQFFRPYTASLAVGSMLILLTVAVRLTAPWVLVLVIDHGIGAVPAPEYLGLLEGAPAQGVIALGAAAGFFLLVLAAVLERAASMRNDTTRRRIVGDIERASFIRLQDNPVAAPIGDEPDASLQRLKGDIERIDAMIAAWSNPVAGALAFVVAALFVMALISPVFALVGAVIVFLVGASASGRRRRTMVAHGATTPESIRRPRFLPPPEIVLAAGLALVLHLAATQTLGGSVTTGGFAVVMTYAVMLRQPIVSLLENVPTMAQ